MIDIETEHVCPLRELRHHPALKRNGRKPHVATLWRWANRGRRGVRLETVMIGGQRCTSHEALQRFIEATTRASTSAAPAPTPPATRQRRAERAARDVAQILHGAGHARKAHA